MKKLLCLLSAVYLLISCSKDSEIPTPTPKPKFTITVAAGEGGSVSSTGGSYEQGSTVSVTATASSGYRFTGWSNGETSATLNITVTGNLSVTALFEKIAYSVDISGAVSKGAFLTGSTLTFYELNNSLSQTGKSYNTDITDNFGTYSLSVEELTEDYARVVGEGFYWNEVTNTNTEEKLSLNAISEVKEGINVNVLTHLEYQRVTELVKNQGKSFSDAKKQALTETLSSLGIETTTDYGTSEQFNFKEGDEKSKILVVASAIIQAERSSAEVTELITTIANDLKDNGNIDEAEVKTDIAVQLAKINLSEVATNIYERYKEQNTELTQANFLSDYLEIAKSEYQEFLPDADGDGVQDDLDLCPDTPEGEEADANGCGKTQKQYQLTTSVEGSGSISEEVIEQPTASYDYGTTVRLTANPITGWEFKEWKGDITSTENPIDVTVVEEVSVTAVFVRKQFALTTSIEGEGTVVVSPEAETYDFQSAVELTATPSEGWVFSEWKGNINSTDNPLSISMNDNKEITAVFKRKQYELTVTVQGEGAVAEEIITEPSQYTNGTSVKLTATGAEGWEFTGWSGDLEGTENPTNITIDKSKSVTATFEKADSDGDGVVDLEDLCPETPEGATVNANGCHDIIYVAENGVTIKARETAIIGDTQAIDDVEYTVVDEAMLREMVAADEDVTKVVTTRVTSLDELFSGKTSFNQDIGSWDTSNVESMTKLFAGSDIGLNLGARNGDPSLFNQDISAWDLSKTTNTTLMFYHSKFNQDIGNWDVSNVKNMYGMFYYNDVFNQDIGKWNIQNVQSLERMFTRAEAFDQDISAWNTSKVQEMGWMFLGAKEFNQNIGNWDVSKVRWFTGMFYGAEKFNKNITQWNMSSATNLNFMFREALEFNQDISGWDVSNVNTLNKMFLGAQKFDQDLSSWCVSSIDVTAENSYENFSTGSLLSETKIPVWGQCGEIYLDDNGITIKARDNAVAGESYKLTNDGESYKVVDETTLREMVAADEDVSMVITTKIANFENLFQNKTNFNDNITSWDLSNATNLKGTFRGATNFNQDIGKWNTSKVVIMSSMFNDATNFDQEIGDWDTSKVLYMDYMFKGAVSFDQDISNWNVGNVTTMYQMFSSGSTFNQPIGNWNVSNVTNMGEMFGNNSAFNQNINSWNVSNVRNMAWMFNSTIFNQPIGNWDVSNVTDMNHMFRFNSRFNQNIGTWDVSSVLNFNNTFVGARAFNQDISSWEVSSATNMDGMFWEAVELNQDLSSWCVSKIKTEPTRFAETTAMLSDNLPIWGQCGEIYLDDNGITIKARDNAVVGELYKLANDGDSYKMVDETMLREMVANNEDVTRVVTTRVTSLKSLFEDNSTFNQDISSWDISNTLTLESIFKRAVSFNQNINSWNTSKVENMVDAFYLSNFNSPIGSWDVSNVTTMSGMFDGNRAFNQNLSNWNVENVTQMQAMFKNTIFNKDISEWDVSKVVNMNYMFEGALFNQDISEWCVELIPTAPISFAMRLSSQFTPNWGRCGTDHNSGGSGGSGSGSTGN